MKRAFTIFVSFIILTLLAGCMANYIKHNPKQALSVGMDFSGKAFVEQNYDEAYKLLKKDLAPDFTVEKLKEVALTMHPSGDFPKNIYPLEYEPVRGQKQINVYLLGESPTEKHYYKLVMIGTEDEGYSVSALYSRPDPFPGAESRIKLERKVN